jgi:DNA excision repair protein ERCC-2
VRDLVEFVLRSGGLSRAAFRSARRAQEGTIGHQQIQQQRPAHYQAEVPVKDLLDDGHGTTIIVQGRIDGIILTAKGWLLEEIKTVVGAWSGESSPLHWAQAKVYAALFARDKGLTEIDIQITYLNLDTDDLTVFRKTFEVDDLWPFYQSLTDEYLEWMQEHAKHRLQRDTSIAEASFPFSKARKGQQSLIRKTSEALQSDEAFLAEAPTGIGKTISVMFAAVKRLPRSGGRTRLAYLTAKTTGHESARKAVADLTEAGVKLAALAFAARDRLCLGAKDGKPCDIGTCPFAQAYFDNRQPAMREALSKSWVGIDELRALGEQHTVCPSALALDLVPWVDVIVGDYNYAFDPQVRLRSLTNEGDREVTLLIDEAHNLPSRARTMFSAELSLAKIEKLKRSLGKQLHDCRTTLEKISHLLRDQELSNCEAIRLERLPSGIRGALRAFLAAADVFLSRGEQPVFHEELLDLYFAAGTFLKLYEMGNELTHALLLEQFGPTRRRALVLRWLCLDPAPLLQKVYDETGPAILFSATLSPRSYFERMLGFHSHTPGLELASPFPEQNLGLIVHTGIATTYKRRAESYGPIAELLMRFTEGKRGNYMAFFSSYDYLRQVEERLHDYDPSLSRLRILSQTPDMGLAERDAFLRHFKKPRTERSRTSLLGLAVLGGAFGEGVDLIGESLIGVAVIGVGLPQICMENDLIKGRFAERPDGNMDESRGFDFAYTYPGFSRVLQAVGRLVRSESDRGIALLVDQRYRLQSYQELFPEWWHPNYIRSANDLEDAQGDFWATQ